MRDSPWLARAGLLLVFTALIVKSSALVFQIVLGRRLHRSGSVDQSFIDGVNGLSTVANIALVICVVLAAVAFIAWVSRAYRNLAEIDAAVHHPSWAVFCWFVPGLNLIRPAEIMGELTNQFSPGRRPKKARWTGQMYAWWGFFLAGAGGHVLLRLTSPETIRHWIFWEAAALLANGMLMVSLFAARGLVQRANVKQIGMRSAPPRLRASAAGPAGARQTIGRAREPHPPS